MLLSKLVIWLCLHAVLLVTCTNVNEAGTAGAPSAASDHQASVPAANQEPSGAQQLPNGQVKPAADVEAHSVTAHKPAPSDQQTNNQALDSQSPESGSPSQELAERKKPLVANKVEATTNEQRPAALKEPIRPTLVVGRMPPPPPPPSRGAQRPPPPPPPPRRPPAGRFPAFLVPSSEPNSFESSSAGFVYVLPSRSRQCFHHRSSKAFLFEFRVLHGGRLDIDAYIVGPGGLIVYESRERRRGHFAVDVKLSASNNDTATEASVGELPLYTICLDNRYSSWYAKVVDFSIQLARRQRGGDGANSASRAGGGSEGPLSEELTAELERLDLSWAQFMDLTNAVEDNLHYSASLQRQLRSNEALDRMAMEDSAHQVTRWSVLQVAVMISVSALQVLMIRALFDEKSLFHRIWKVRGTLLVKS